MFQRLLSSIAAAALLSSVGCQDYLFEQKCREAVKEAEISQPAVKPTPADILFVVDNSGSMADEQENLAQNFDVFIRNISGGGDYQIAVVTTDLDNGTKERGGVRTVQFSSMNPPAEFTADNYNAPGTPGVCQDLDIDHGCLRGPNAADRIVKSTMPPETQIRVFQDNVRVGSCGSGNEQGLAAMMRALNQAQGNGCNRGFLRDEANLVVVLVSDEEDGSPGNVAEYLDALGRVKRGGFQQIRVAAIVGSVNGEGKNCRTEDKDRTDPKYGSETSVCGSLCNQCPGASWCGSINQTLWNLPGPGCAWCSFYNVADCCSAIGGNRYVQFATNFERAINRADERFELYGCRGEPGKTIGCLIDSICKTSFAATLERIARELVISSSFTLDPPAIFPPGVQVTLKNGRFGAGTLLTYGRDFTVSENGATVTLLPPNIPQEGEDIDIQFAVSRENPTDDARGACAP